MYRDPGKPGKPPRAQDWPALRHTVHLQLHAGVDGQLGSVFVTTMRWSDKREELKSRWIGTTLHLQHLCSPLSLRNLHKSLEGMSPAATCPDSPTRCGWCFCGRPPPGVSRNLDPDSKFEMPKDPTPIVPGAVSSVVRWPPCVQEYLHRLAHSGPKRPYTRAYRGHLWTRALKGKVLFT